MEANKKKGRLFAGLIIIAAVLVICFVIINLYIDQKRKTTFSFTDESDHYAYQVENISFNENEVFIKGWFFELMKVQNTIQEINNDSILSVLIYDINSDEKKYVDGTAKPSEGVLCTVERTIRTDVNEYFKCEYDYSNSGFIAKINKEDIDIENGQYQIIFKIRRDGYTEDGIPSNAFIDKGKLKYISPKEEIPLDVKGTDLEKIIQNGYCLASCPDNHISIYQYNKQLYWITDEYYSFEMDESTYIQYQVETTQYDRLPIARKENGWFWDNIGDDFEKHEITDKMDCGKYRVSVREIPQSYSVYLIITGYYTDETVWRKSLRPVFLYED